MGGVENDIVECVFSVFLCVSYTVSGTTCTGDYKKEALRMHFAAARPGRLEISS